MFKRIFHIPGLAKDTKPRAAYNRWAGSYDQQPDNLMLALDEQVFNELLENISLVNQRIVDIGCGTGRHWGKILEQNPAELEGFDVSEGMLRQLRNRFPGATTYLTKGFLLPEKKAASADIIISTLMVAHIKKIELALEEWNRILKSGGFVLITDFHPQMLSEGGKRSFKEGNKTVFIRNYVHLTQKIKDLSSQMNWELLRFIEKIADETVLHFYEKQSALDLYEKIKGKPLIYGMLLQKK